MKLGNYDRQTDQPTNQPTDRPTDRQAHREISLRKLILGVMEAQLISCERTVGQSYLSLRRFDPEKQIKDICNGN